MPRGRVRLAVGVPVHLQPVLRTRVAIPGHHRVEEETMNFAKRARALVGNGWWQVGIAVAIVSVGATTHGAVLVNKGGSSDVPTYEGRVYYVKPTGATCPSAFNCFCNSGSTCSLPGTGTITGTVIIDRPGVTLDCQNRAIVAPRFSGTRQACTSNSTCGQGPGSAHPCVSGYCQLDNLAGINIGGPLRVDDAPINLNVNATGYVQDVTVINCVVRLFAAGYNVDGFTGDNGLDLLEVVSSEFLGNGSGLQMTATDSSYVNDISTHDNSGYGIYANYNWGLSIVRSTSELNGIYLPIYLVGSPPSGGQNNRRLIVSYNNIFTDASNTALRMENLEPDSAAPCDNEAALCDARIEGNAIHTPGSPSGGGIRLNYYPDTIPAPGPKVLLRNNTIKINSGSIGGSHVTSVDPIQPKCWNKGNVCFSGIFTGACTKTELFSSSTCWY
jgi:hypothetical protein